MFNVFNQILLTIKVINNNNKINEFLNDLKEQLVVPSAYA